MSAKKILVIVGGVVAVFGLIIALFVGGITWFAVHTIGNSEPAETARAFLRNSEVLKRDIGPVKNFGWFIAGNINTTNGEGAAQLNLKVIGKQKTVNATVELIFRSGHPWRVTAASYRNEAGETIDLLNPYDSPQVKLGAEPVFRKPVLKLAA